MSNFYSSICKWLYILHFGLKSADSDGLQSEELAVQIILLLLFYFLSAFRFKGISLDSDKFLNFSHLSQYIFLQYPPDIAQFCNIICISVLIEVLICNFGHAQGLGRYLFKLRNYVINNSLISSWLSFFHSRLSELVGWNPLLIDFWGVLVFLCRVLDVNVINEFHSLFLLAFRFWSWSFG